MILQAARVAVLLVTFPTADPVPPETLLAAARQTMDKVEAYYGAQSYGRFTLTSDVWGVYDVPLDHYASREAVAEAARAAATAAGVDLSVYTHFLYVSPHIDGTAGYGDNAGAWIAASDAPDIGFRHGLVAHELGHHIFGLGHVVDKVCDDGTPLGGRKATCLFAQDWIEVMGAGVGAGDFNAAMKEVLGWTTIQTVTTGGTYTLAPFETTGGVKAIGIPAPTHDQPARRFVIEYRQPIGWDALIRYDPLTFYDGVLVRQEGMLLWMNPPNDSLPTRPPPTLRTGQSYCDQLTQKVSFTVLSATPQGATVRVTWGRCR